jgi:hypothetical protein
VVQYDRVYSILVVDILLRYNRRDPLTVDTWCEECLEARLEDGFCELCIAINEIIELGERV